MPIDDDDPPEGLYRTMRPSELRSLALAFEADRAVLVARDGPAASLAFCDGRLALIYRLLREEAESRPPRS